MQYFGEHLESKPDVYTSITSCQIFCETEQRHRHMFTILLFDCRILIDGNDPQKRTNHRLLPQKEILNKVKTKLKKTEFSFVVICDAPTFTHTCVYLSSSDANSFPGVLQFIPQRRT